MKKVLKWLDTNLEIYLSVLLMSISTVVIFVQVVMRYVFRSSLVWSEEYARYCIIWLIFLAASYGCKKRVHIKIEAALKLFPRKLRPYIEIIGELLVLVLAAYIFITGMQLTQFQVTYHKISAAMGLPMWVVYLAPVTGFGLIIIREIQNVWFRVAQLGPAEEGK